MNKTNWQRKKLKEISQVHAQYGWTTSSSVNKSDVKLLRTTDITKGSVSWDNVPYAEKLPPNIDKYTIHKGDILISRAGSIGFSYLVKSEPEYPTVFASYLIRFKTQINPFFLKYYLDSPYYWQFIEDKRLGIAVQNINATKLNELEIPIPPENIQQEIVQYLDEQFSKIDAGIEELNKIKKQLEVYRQAVLKSAFEGHLSEEFRIKSGNSVNVKELIEESISKALYKKIKFINVDDAKLPTMPKTWAWSSITKLVKMKPNSMKAGPFGSALKKEFYVDKGYKIYGQEQVIKNDHKYGNYYIDADKFRELKSCEAKPGDILISLVGTSGKVLILPENSEPGIINPRLVKFSLNENLLNSQYFKYYLESNLPKSFFKISQHGATMNILNMSILKNLPIPVPPILEQQTIVELIAFQYSLIDKLEETVVQSLIQSKNLKQSILKEIFN